MDAFVAMRQYLYQNGGIVNRISNIESKDLEQDVRPWQKDLLFYERRFHFGRSAERIAED